MLEICGYENKVERTKLTNNVMSNVIEMIKNYNELICQKHRTCTCYLTN